MLTRRNFLKLPLAGAVAIAVPGISSAREALRAVNNLPPLEPVDLTETPVRALYQYCIDRDAYILRLDVLSGDGLHQLHVDVKCTLKELRDKGTCKLLVDPALELLRNAVKAKKITTFKTLPIPSNYWTNHLEVLPSYIAL